MAGSKDILVANTTAFIKHDGRRIMLRRGVTLVRADDPVAREHKAMFEPLDVGYLGRGDAPVEQATAAPGEKRDLSSKRVRDDAGESKPARKSGDSK